MQLEKFGFNSCWWLVESQITAQSTSSSDRKAWEAEPQQCALTTNGCLQQDVIKYELTGELGTLKAEMNENRMQKYRVFTVLEKLTDSRPRKVRQEIFKYFEMQSLRKTSQLDEMIQGNDQF